MYRSNSDEIYMGLNVCAQYMCACVYMRAVSIYAVTVWHVSSFVCRFCSFIKVHVKFVYIRHCIHEYRYMYEICLCVYIYEGCFHFSRYCLARLFVILWILHKHSGARKIAYIRYCIHVYGMHAPNMSMCVYI